MVRVRIRDESKDKAYFTITPRLVWALSRDPYDYILWDVIKTIAGDAGECYISTENLAVLAMMSMGKASACRKHLIEAGLLQGEVRKDPGYPQPVWHLTIPDLWPRNLELSERLVTIRSRVEYKQEQAKERQEMGREKREKERERKRQKSLHGVKPSHSEEGYTHGETKNIQRISIGGDDDDGLPTALTGDNLLAFYSLVYLGIDADVARIEAGRHNPDLVLAWCASLQYADANNLAGLVLSKLRAEPPTIPVVYDVTLSGYKDKVRKAIPGIAGILREDV